MYLCLSLTKRFVLKVDMVEDSASEEDDGCTPPDAAMDVNVSCDDECAEPVKSKFEYSDYPRRMQ